jgi:two-component system, NarL family, response regulator DesR
MLINDQPSVRRGLKMRFMLEPDLEVVGEASGVAEAISLARALRPDVVLLDVEVQGTDGTSNIAALRQAAPHSAVVIFTLYDDGEVRERAREVGAAAFVAKHQTEETLLATIRRAAMTNREQRRHGGTVEQHGRSGA